MPGMKSLFPQRRSCIWFTSMSGCAVQAYFRKEAPVYMTCGRRQRELHKRLKIETLKRKLFCPEYPEKPGKLEVGGASRDPTGFGALEEGLISS